MVSACAYSGAYPTGYGRYGKNTEGVPEEMFETLQASGFTHFQQSGTGAIRKYYNYVRVTPMVQPLDDLGEAWPLHDESAAAGYYAATLDTGIHCEITVGEKVAVHRYTFPESRSARVVVDLSCGGLDIELGRTVPLRAYVESLGHGQAQGTVVLEGVPLSVHLEVHSPGWRQMLWHDRRLIEGGTRLDFDSIRQTTLRPFGLLFMGPVRAGQVVEVRLGFSLRGCEQARENLQRECGEPRAGLRRGPGAHRRPLGRPPRPRPGGRRHARAAAGDGHRALPRADQAVLRRRREPVLAGVRAVRVRHLHHVGHLQDPDPAADGDRARPGHGSAGVVDPGLRGGGQLPDRVPDGPRRGPVLPAGQRARPHRVGGRARARARGLDWSWALVHMVDDLRRLYGEDFFEHGLVHPITHTLDLAYGNHCTAQVARALGDKRLADELEVRSRWWVNGFDPSTGLLRDSEFYEGGKWNYSFRLLHDMRARIALAGGDDAFVAMLDAFFGFGTGAVTQPGRRPAPEEIAAGLALNRFEGLNNEPDMEAPWAYHYAGRPDRTAEVVHAALTWQYGTGAGGLPGNDDSGGLSSWYVWASLGLFPVAGQSLFLVNAPAFARAALRVAGGEFVIETTGHREGARRRGRRRGDTARPVRAVGAAERTAAGDHPHQRDRRAPRRRAATRTGSGAVAVGAHGPSTVAVRRAQGRCAA